MLSKRRRRENKSDRSSSEMRWAKRTRWTKFSWEELDISSFESNDSNHEAFIKLKIVVAFARRWRTTSQTNDCRCIRSCSSRKAFSSRTCARDASISRIICSFDLCQLCYRRAALAIILDKRSSMFCSSAVINRRTDKACFEMRKRRIYASCWTSRRDWRRQSIDWWKSIY
jgi:hypothetical protein